VPLAEFFVGYRKTVLSHDELITSIHIPLPSPPLQRFYKVSKRVLDDISTVAAAFALELDDRRIVRRLRIAYAGVAATPLRALQAEQAALGQPWQPSTWSTVAKELASSATPITDRRGSADYRRAMITRLFERFCGES
jgi:xanthine dehydrogenase small subunit